jgi:FkbM family methyltransferase
MIEDFDKNLFKKCLPHFSKQPVIFDVGAHEGRWTEFARQLVPNAKHYLFEPNIELAIKIGAYPLAISDHDGFKTFYVPPKKNDELASLYKREVFKQTGYEEIVATCISIDTFCIRSGIEEIDYLKVDVEGAELDVLNGCKEMMASRNIKFIQIEYGGTYPDAGITFAQIINAANKYGYNVYDDALKPVTINNFIEDYRYAVFLLTYIKC